MNRKQPCMPSHSTTAPRQERYEESEVHGIDDDERQVNAVPGTKGPSRGFNDSSGKKSGDSLGQSGGRPRKSSKGNINVPHSPPGPPGGTNHHVKLPKNETTPEKDHAGNKQYRKKKPHPPPPKVLRTQLTIESNSLYSKI